MFSSSIRRGLIVLVASVALAGCSMEPSAEPDRELSPAELWADHMLGLPFVIGYEKGIDEARSQNKPAMMFVTATWCGWCRRLAQDNFNDPEIRSLLANFVCVIVDGDVEGGAKKELDATQGYPIVVFVAPDGRELARCTGYVPPDEFKEAIEFALNSLQELSAR